MRFENFIIKYRILIIILSVVVTGLLAIPLFHTSINSDLRAYLPDDMPSQVNTDKIEAIFGSTDPVLLVFESDDVLNTETLKRIKSLSKEFNKRKEFEHVLSLFDSKEIKGENGAMIVDPAIKRIPKSEKSREKLRKSIKNNELVYKLIVSEDFRYTLMMLNIKKGVSDMVSLPLIDSLIAAYPGKGTVYKAGEPYLRTTINDDISGDMSLLLPIGLLIMLVFLYFSFKEMRGVILPFLVVIMSIIVSMGLIPLFGWEISLLTVLVPIMMIAMANDYGVHFIAAYQERNAEHPQWSMQQIVTDTLKHLKKPIIVAALTTAAGILALLAHVMIPAQQVGVVAAIGISFALILSLFFLPAILAGMKKGKVQKNLKGDRKSILIRILSAIGTLISNKPKKVLIFSLVFTILVGTGISKIIVDSNIENMLPQKHPFRQATNILNEHFGGTKNISVLFEGDIKDPGLMKKLDYYETELKKMPQVGQAASIATVIRIISKAINDKTDTFYDKIPDSREAIAQYIELYQMSGDPDDFEQLVDFNYTKAVLNIQVKATDNKAIKEVLAKVDELTKNDPNMKLIGGFCLVVNDLADAIIKGQGFSLALAILIIALLLMLVFRSVVAGLIGSIPLVITIIILFGSMGYLGVKLDIVTALLSSIVVGAGVDYTIHFLWRYKEERANGKSGSEAVILTLETTGRGITINALSVIVGFIALFVSAFVSLKYFAFLIIFSIFFCLITALIVVPAMCLVFKPKFLEPKEF